MESLEIQTEGIQAEPCLSEKPSLHINTEHIYLNAGLRV